MQTEDASRTITDQLIELLRVEADRQAIKEALQDAHPADIADALDDSSEETRKMVMNLLDQEQTIEVLDEVEEGHLRTFVGEADVAHLADIVDHMPSDEAADILFHAEPEKAEEVLTHVAPDTAKAVRILRTYKPDSAGGIMTTEFFHVGPDDTAGAVLERLKKEEEAHETVREIFVCGDNLTLQGVIGVEDLLKASPETRARALMETAAITVSPFVDQEMCARYMEKYDLMVLPVVDMHHRMVGIITFDDILDVLSEEAAEDMYRMAGVGAKNPLEEGTWTRAFKRLPWFIVTLVGMSLLGAVISAFQGTLEKVVALSFFIPAIMGLGGNVGMQSATITVRGLGTGDIGFKDFWWMLRRETLVAIIVGIVCATALGGVAYGMLSLGMETKGGGGIHGASAHAGSAVERNIHGVEEEGRLAVGQGAAAARDDEDGAVEISPFRFAVTVILAMFCGIMGSVVLGTSVPMICHRFGIDPAIAAGPFVTTLIDMGTQTIYLGLGTYMLLQ